MKRDKDAMKARDAEICRLIEAGFTHERIGRWVGVTRGRVQQIGAKHGLEARGKGKLTEAQINLIEDLYVDIRTMTFGLLGEMFHCADKAVRAALKERGITPACKRWRAGPTKRCRKCKERKPHEDFSLVNGRRSSHCNACKAAASRQWVQDNMERVLRRNRRVDRRIKAAYATVQTAVQAGELEPVKTLDCAQCGKPAQHYHHDCYCEDHRLAVTPLCVSCHKLLHSNGHPIDQVEDMGTCVWAEAQAANPTIVGIGG